MIAFYLYPCLSSRLRSAMLLVPMLSALVLVLPPCAHAQKLQVPQENTFRFRRLGTEQGLAQNTVFDVLQDKKGFLWIATGDGLCRWDGYNVKTWRHDPKDSTSLSNYNVTRLAKDSLGNIWVGTLDGLNQFDKKTGKFERYYNPNRFQTKEWTFNMTNAKSVLVKGDSLFAVTVEGLCYVNRLTKTLVPVPCRDGSDSLLQFDKITLRFYSHSYPPLNNKDCIYLLHVFQHPTYNRFDCIEYNIRTQHYLVKNFYPPKGILPEFDNARWQRLWCIDSKGSCWIEFGISYKKISLLRWHPVELGGTGIIDTNSIIAVDMLGRGIGVLEDEQHNIWVRHGRFYDTFDTSYRRINRIILNSNSQDTSSLGSPLVLDNSSGSYAPGRNWIATDGSGVNFMLPPIKFPHFTPFRSRMCWSMAEDNLGNLWVATMGDGGGLGAYNLRTGKVEEYLPKSRCYSVLHDSKGNIWTAKAELDSEKDQGSLLKFPSNGSKRRTMVKYALDKFYHPQCILEDKLGMLWLSSNDNVVRFDPKTGKITHRFDNLGMILKTDSKGRIWAGGRGVFVFDPADVDRIRFYGQDSTPHLFTRYVNDPKNPRSLGNDVVKCFHEADDGTMWIATITGLDHLDPKTGTFRHYTEADGMPNNYTYGILPDNTGNLWISTNRGLSRFNPKTGTWRNYSPADGLQSYEFDRLSFCKLRDGRLVFGGVNGFNIFRPEDVQDNTTPPPVAIVELEINDRPFQQVLKDFAPNTPQYGIREVSELTTLELGYNDNTLTFDFAALDFTDPAKNLYAYKMDGVDKDWVQSGTLRKTRYAGLPPGDYTFRVKACNNDGVWNEEGTALRIRILPPFWRTAWFIGLVVLSGVLSIGGGTRFVVRSRFRRRIERLEAAQALEREQMQRELVLERERGRIAKDIHDEVGPGMMRIALLAEAVQEGNIHSSEHISLTAQEVIDAMNGIIWMTNPKNDTLDNLAAYIQEKATEWFERIGEERGMTLNVVLPDVVPSLSLEGNVRRNLYLCVKEALNNTLKHSAASRVELALAVQGKEGFEWSVRDNGQGFEQNSVSRFSNGLANMRSRMEEIGGTCQVESVSGQGTTVRFIVG